MPRISGNLRTTITSPKNVVKEGHCAVFAGFGFKSATVSCKAHRRDRLGTAELGTREHTNISAQSVVIQAGGVQTMVDPAAPMQFFCVAC